VARATPPRLFIYLSIQCGQIVAQFPQRLGRYLRRRLDFHCRSRRLRRRQLREGGNRRCILRHCCYYCASGDIRKAQAHEHVIGRRWGGRCLRLALSRGDHSVSSLVSRPQHLIRAGRRLERYTSIQELRNATTPELSSKGSPSLGS
jgi:hypothetical protein